MRSPRECKGNIGTPVGKPKYLPLVEICQAVNVDVLAPRRGDSVEVEWD